MISATITVDDDILDAYAELSRTAPRLVQQTFPTTINRTAEQALQYIRQEPDSPKYPIRWKSERQRRYVMAMLRARGNLPYERTHELSAGWSVEVNTALLAGSVTLTNPAPQAEYVQGLWQQPFHEDTGWRTDTETYVKFSEQLQDDLIRQWYILNTVIIPNMRT